MSLFTPTFLLAKFIRNESLPYTLAFSNTPGLQKPLIIDGKKSVKSSAYIITPGHCGLAFCLLSYAGYFTITCVVDDTIHKQPEIFVKLIEKNINKCIKEKISLDN